MSKSKVLTNKAYWQSYYKNSNTVKKVTDIVNICSYYDPVWDKIFTHDKNEKKSIIEIGGYPGRYLAYLSKKYNLMPVCLDYNSDTKEVEYVFELFGIKDYKILSEDLFKFKPVEKYDYVFSNGFIEHFEDYNKVLDLHLDYLKPGGALCVMIPNKRGYKRLYQQIVDVDNLKLHNLNCMSKDVFKEFAKRNNLKIEYLSYYGGFGFNIHGNSNFFKEIIVRSHRLMFKRFLNKYIERYPNRIFSDVLIGIFKKNIG
jgi:SAM-dependent methyltransferase